jgi:glutathionylspermidine synthase
LTDEIAQDSHAMLSAQLARRGLIFGDRPLCTVLRPRFITPEQHRLMAQRVAILMRAFAAAYAAAIAEPAVRAQFRLADWEEQMLAYDPGFAEPSPHSRLDFFIDEDGGMALTEYNAETPAGAGFNDALADAFSDIRVMREFARRYDVRPVAARHGVLHTLLDAWRQFSGSTRAPSIAIVDWPDVPTRNEFVLFQQYFDDRGVKTTIVDPRAMEYRNGRLYADGGVVDLVYKRVLLHELVADGGLEQPLVRAVRDRAVCMVNPFRCKILHKKASLAVLSDERNAHLFGAEESAAIKAHVPWTRVVEERKTMYGGTQIDLVPFMLEKRAQLVLKPNDDYGGSGIVLGWQADAAEWERAIRAALAAPYIVQEKVRIASEPYPSLADGRLQIYDRMLDTAPFVAYGRHEAGCLTRLSTSALLNVTAGGGSTVPMFLVQPR